MTTPLDLISIFDQRLRDFNYSPTTRWDHFFNPQIVFNSNPRDVAVESEVLSKVGSYGKQLSIILEAVAAISQQVPTPSDPKQVKAIEALQKLHKDAKDAAHQCSSLLERSAVDEFVKQLEHAKDEDETRYREVVRRLQSTLKRLGEST